MSLYVCSLYSVLSLVSARSLYSVLKCKCTSVFICKRTRNLTSWCQFSKLLSIVPLYIKCIKAPTFENFVPAHNQHPTPQLSTFTIHRHYCTFTIQRHHTTETYFRALTFENWYQRATGTPLPSSTTTPRTPMAGVSDTHELARTRAKAPSASRTGPAASSRELARTVQTGSRVAALSLALRASQEEVERLRGLLQDVESLKSVKPVCRYV